MSFWPAADPREVVDLAGAGTAAAGVSEANLGEELKRWRGIVARRRLVALVRRNGALALGLAALLEILAQFGLFPQWVVVAVPLVLFVVAVAVFAANGPSPFELARLLDDKLGLNDRLATALEIQARGGGETYLEQRTVSDAAGLLAAGREDWHASAGRGGREWWVFATPVVVLLVAVAIGAAVGSGSSSGQTSALGPRGGAGGGANEGKKAKARTKAEKHLAPTGKLHKFKGKKVPPSQIAAEESKEGYQKIPQGYKTSGKEAKGKSGETESGKAKAENIHKAAQGKAGANESRQGTKAGNGPNAAKENEHPTVGFNVKSKKSGNHGRPGNSEVSGGGAKKSAPNGAGDETSASASEKKGGQPAGTNHAGGEQGNNQQGHATPINTKSASQAVKIQPGYAPSRSTKGGKEKKKTGDSQGAGGKARTATVTGGTQVGDEFSYVPAAGGAVPGASAGLQLNYLNSLKWVERLPW
jgi:hypothetical protein